MSIEPTKFSSMINEGSTAKYSATLKDEAGTVIPASAISALTLTLSNVVDGAIINSRDEQNALNAIGMRPPMTVDRQSLAIK